MILKKCILTENDCYKKGTKMTGNKPTGIVVHSTGANNKELRRYVQPLKTYSDYDTIIADLGTNKYGNHWNRSSLKMGRKVCVHAFIGVNAKGEIETYQTLPFDICCWGVGAIPYDKNGKELSSSKSSKFHHYGPSYNYNPQARVQFEICEDNLKDEDYFNKIFKEAAEFCAYICKTYGLTTKTICSHYESYKAGYGGNHGDCDHWLKKFGKDMDWFRAEVDKLLVENTEKKDVNKVTVTLSVLKKGSKGEEVKTLQRLLLALCYDLKSYGADGSFGGVTETAVKKFQKDNGLSADGSVGPATWNKLLKG